MSPTLVPLDGGGLQVTIDGFNLSKVDAAEFCPVAADGGGCISGTDVVPQSDTSLTVTAPDATASLVDNATALTTDTIVTDDQGVASPVASPADNLTFGCNEQAVTDGSFQVLGCLTDEAGGHDVTATTSSLDGLPVPASPTDTVDYDTAAASMSAGAGSTLSLSLGPKSTEVASGPLDLALDQPLGVSVPPSTSLAGMAISGTLTVAPDALGEAAGTVGVTLPPVLGATNGTLSFLTSTGSGLSNLAVSAPQAELLDLFSLSGVTMTFSPGAGAAGTWHLQATASAGGAGAAKLTGTLGVNAAGTLTAGSVKVGPIVLAGIVKLGGLTLTYGSGHWTGSATITQSSPPGSESAAISLTFAGGTLSAATVSASDVPVFGVLEAAGFTMTDTGGTWTLTLTGASPGTGATATLSESGGVIDGGTLVVSGMSFLDQFDVATAGISYAEGSSNPGCPGVTGSEIWCGQWQVQLPQASAGDDSPGTIAFAAAAFSGGSVSVSGTGTVPLLNGITLTNLDGTLSVHRGSPTIAGPAGLTFGPTVNFKPLFTLTGTLTHKPPTATAPGAYDASGAVSSGAEALGTAGITAPDGGTKAPSFRLSLGPSPSTGLSFTAKKVTVTVTGALKGTLHATAFALKGPVGVGVGTATPVMGTMKADKRGMAACATAATGSVGFKYVWSTGKVSTFGTTGCSLKGF